MTEKRFATNGYYIYDTFHDGIKWLVNEVEVQEIVNKMNNLDLKARERSKALSKLQKENEQLRNRINDWHQRTFKAHEYFDILEKIIDEVCNDDISNQIWKEYEKREKLIE